MKRDKVIFYVATGLMSALMLMSVFMYFTKHDQIASFFEFLSYPSYLVYPLAIAKLLGLIAIWTRLSTTLTYFAYAGFLYDFILALVAHLSVSDGEHNGAIMALVVWTVSFIYYKKNFA